MTRDDADGTRAPALRSRQGGQRRRSLLGVLLSGPAQFTFVHTCVRQIRPPNTQPESCMAPEAANVALPV